MVKVCGPLETLPWDYGSRSRAHRGTAHTPPSRLHPPRDLERDQSQKKNHVSTLFQPNLQIGELCGELIEERGAVDRVSPGWDWGWGWGSGSFELTPITVTQTNPKLTLTLTLPSL